MKNWFVLKMKVATSAVRMRDLLTAAHIDFFLPMTKSVAKRGGKEETVEKPLLFSYIFVRTTEPEADAFCRANHGITFLREHTPNGTMGPHLVIPDYQMDNFIRAVEQYTDDIPFVAPTPEMLAKGDRVRIIGGPFRGIEGILEARQGKDGGRVIVRVGDIVAIPTVEISPEFIEVLEFAPEGRHLYQKLDSFQPRLRLALDCRAERKPIPSEFEMHLRVFVRRFSNLEVSTLNARVRFLAYLMLAYALIEHDGLHANSIADQLRELRPQLNSKKSVSLLDDALLRLEKLTKMKNP